MNAREALARFLDVAPTLFGVCGDKHPVGFCFHANGECSEVNAFVGGDRDDGMNGLANAIISVVKMAGNVEAVAVVSETFIQRLADPAKRLPPVDCGRFDRDDSYREQILKERREAFTVMVEDGKGSRVVMWTIVREANKRRLGERTEVTGMRGRFANLLHKSHATDPIVETAPATNPEHARNPQPIEELRRRFPDALQKTCGVESAGTAEIDRHIFDSEEIRLIVDPFGERLGVIGFNFGAPVPASKFRPRIIELFNRISGYEVTDSTIRNVTTRLAESGVLAIQVDRQDAPAAAQGVGRDV